MQDLIRKAIRGKEYYAENRDKILKKQKEYDLNRKRDQREYDRKHYMEVKRPRKLLNKYGITVEDYNVMLKSQCGLCKLCSKPPLKNNTFVIDHDHKTGKVRGIIHITCNTGMHLVDLVGIEKIKSYVI